MRRLTDVTITTADRPAPPRATSGRTKSARAAARAEPRPRRRRLLPNWLRRLFAIVMATTAVAIVAGGGWWLVKSGVYAAAERTTTDRLVALSLRAGLRVDDIEVEGRKRLLPQDLLAALGIKQGDPILGVDLAAARGRLAALPGVESVTIERRLPGELRVLVAERDPVAIWQNDGRYQLVDRAGQPAGDNIDSFPGLPLVVGVGAPDHVAELLALLGTEPALQSRVKASQWVSQRHWTIQMTGAGGDIEVRLPEDDPVGAWHQLAHLESEQKLLDRKVSVVDMRLPDRLVVRVPGGIEQPTKAAPTTRSPARHKAPGRDA